MIGHFSVFSAFRCAMFYMSIFITFVEKTSVNAQPLSSPIFEKMAPDFKNKVFFLFCFFTFAFFILFHIFVNFRLPLPPPGPDWSHLWSILVPFLFGFGRSWRTKQSFEPVSINTDACMFERGWNLCNWLRRAFGLLACVIIYWLLVINP